MSTLYIAPSACSLASHALVYELDLPIRIEKVTVRTPESPIHSVNPLGRVPALVLNDGSLLTENTALLPYLADQKPEAGLCAPVGTPERAQIQRWLGYLATEIHVGCFRPLRRPERYSDDESAHPAIQAKARLQLHQALLHVEQHLQGKTWLVAERYTIADLYLSVFAGWLPALGEPFNELTAINSLRDTVCARSAVQKALKLEGLIP